MTRETIIKSALKYLVKMQIEEGSVGFAVDNDPDHDVCWDDVLAWLEAQPCEDCISREAVKALIKRLSFKYYMECGEYIGEDSREVTLINALKFEECFKDLPLVTPQRPRGEWIKVDNEEPIAYDCSECNIMVSKRYNYCPECGAYMRGEEDANCN